MNVNFIFIAVVVDGRKFLYFFVYFYSIACAEVESEEGNRYFKIIHQHFHIMSFLYPSEVHAIWMFSFGFVGVTFQIFNLIIFLKKFIVDFSNFRYVEWI